jgi:hypothetical protein
MLGYLILRVRYGLQGGVFVLFCGVLPPLLYVLFDRLAMTLDLLFCRCGVVRHFTSTFLRAALGGYEPVEIL